MAVRLLEALQLSENTAPPQDDITPFCYDNPVHCPIIPTAVPPYPAVAEKLCKQSAPSSTLDSPSSPTRPSTSYAGITALGGAVVVQLPITMAGRRGAASRQPSTHMLLSLVLTCCWLALCSASTEFYIAEQMIDNADVSPLNSGRLLVDPRPPPPIPNPKAWTLATEQDALQRRGLESESNNKDESTSSPSSSSSSVQTSMAQTQSISAATAHHTQTTSTSSSLPSLSTQSSLPSSSPLPTPFDQGFAGNMTESCTNFFNQFLADSTFTSCLPFSLLLQNSESFFQASKSILAITQTLDATCAANVNTCTNYMNSLSGNLTNACASDLSAQNPTVEQAQLGLEAYSTLYTASCLRNPTTSAYCFAAAVTNASSPTDSYIYYLPLNISLPGGAAPTCDECLINTMAVFDKATADRSSPLASDYAAAAQQINLHCGPSFVNTTLAVASSPSIAGRASVPGAELALVVLLGALVFGGF